MNNLKVKKSNDLRFTATKTVGKESITVNIRLNDECKNGHQDFSITGDIYEAGKPKTDRYFLSGGCIHEEILKHFPEYKIFVDLHLCDYTGAPIYAIENGFYHLKHGLGTTPTGSANFKTEFCEYYRLTPSQYDVISTSQNKVQYYLNLQKLGVFEQWNKQAKNAIAILENLTDTQFIVDSKRTQINPPTEAEIAEELKRIKEGYYTPEAIAERTANYAKSKLEELQIKMLSDKAAAIEKIEIEYQVKKQVLLIGGEKALQNCIFYNHTKQLAFNWRGYDHISQELIDKVKAEAILPEGVTIK